MTNFVFAIPVAPFTTDEAWDVLNTLLGNTLASVAQQSDRNFTVFVSGHERPPVLDRFAGDGRFKFLPVKFGKPEADRAKRNDKYRKRWQIAWEYRKLGGGYFMYLDADDFVHRDLVKFVREDDNRVGYRITQGYAFDYRSGRIAPVPGVWNQEYDRVCGSSGVLFMVPEDLPKGPYTPETKASLSNAPYFMIESHKLFETIEWHGGRLAPIPFPAGMYSLNTGANLSFSLVRDERRRDQLNAKIERLAMADVSPIVQAFGISKVFKSSDLPAAWTTVVDEISSEEINDQDKPPEKAAANEGLTPHMTKAERIVLRKWLAGTRAVLEFGCGGSTKFAVDNGVQKLWSVESDKAWIERLSEDEAIKSAIDQGRLIFHHGNVGPVGRWGKPADESKKPNWHRYHSAIWKELDPKALDLVFVDGRFRIACALQALLRTRPDCVVVMHDFWRRDHYHSVLQFVDVLERTDELAVLRRKPDADMNAMLNLLFDNLIRTS